MGEVVRFPLWMTECEPRFRAFDDAVTGKVLILPTVRIEREPAEPPPRTRARVR